MTRFFTRMAQVFLLLLSFLTILPPTATAQLPACSATGGIVYDHTTTNTIANWDPLVPLSATNPVTNTIAMPPGAVGLAVSNNLNSTTAPSPTFYTNVNGFYYYYNGTTWVNTGHTAGAVNLGGGGSYLYGIEGGSGSVYRYDGTGNATLVLVVPGFDAGGPFDVVGDCAGNFYILRTLAPAWLRKYSPTGTLLQEWTVTGAPSTGSGGGFAIVGNMMYHHNAGLYQGVIGATTVTCTPVTGTFPSPGDFASCPVGGLGAMPASDTLFNCIPGTPKTVTASGTAPFSYTLINGSATITGTGPSYNVTNTQPATIVLRSTSLSSCTPFNLDTFTVVPAPTVNAGPDDTLYGCASYRDTLKGTLTNATSWITYTLNWTPTGIITSGGNTANPIVAPLSDTTFVLTVTTSAAQGGCTLKDSVRLKVKDESILPDYTFAIKYTCTGDTVRFTNTSVRGTASLWDFADGSTDTATHPVHRYNNQGIYNVRLISSNYLCRDSAIKIVDTRHPLIAAYTADKDTICQNTMVTFTGGSTISVLPGTVFWNFGDGGTSTLTNPTHTFTIPGTYQVMLAIKDAVPCTDTVYHTIVVDSAPSLGLNLDNHDICTGQSVNFTGAYTLSGNIGLDWNFGDGTLAGNVNPTSHAYDNQGTYYITLTSRYRVCNDLTQKDSVNVHPVPLVNLGRDTVLCLQGNPLFLANLAPGQPGDRYRWNTGDTSALLKVVHDGIYNLLVTTRYDCNAQDEVQVKKDCYIDVPNSFTPNGDGINDYFFPRQFLSESVAGFSMKIFNRWGQVVYETTHPAGRGWDGRFNDKEQPLGVYVYQVKVTFKNGKIEEHSGNVTLLR